MFRYIWTEIILPAIQLAMIGFLVRTFDKGIQECFDFAWEFIQQWLGR
ncbi:MAG: hypothetical protein Q4B33_07170 [Fusobacterium sp.]|nr:hypothetical protein [Fusobacterium sp.]